MAAVRPALWPFVMSGGSVAVVSSFVPLSYDEGDWLATTRRLALGGSLYGDILENKTPPFLYLVRGLDALPGPYPLARALFLGATVAAVGLAVFLLCTRLGVRRQEARNLGIVMAGGVALQSMFVLDIEKPAIIFVFGGILAIAYGRPAAGGSIASLASLYDIRAILLTIGVVLFSAERGGKRGAVRCGSAAAIVGLSLATIVASHPDLRYALIELNAAQRVVGGWRPGAMLVVALAATLPVIIGSLWVISARTPRALAGARASKAGTTLLLTTVAIAIASRYPFYKYWLLALPGLALVSATKWHHRSPGPRPVATRQAVALLLLTSIPALIHAVDSNLTQARIVSRYERAARFLDAALPKEGRFAAFDVQPFLGVYLPRRASVHWTVLDFVAVETSRTGEDLVRAARAIERSDVIVDDGALSVQESSVAPHYRPVWRVFRSHLDAFPCIRMREGLTFRFRNDRCPKT